MNFTAFTIKLWELITDDWMIIYSKKIMKAVKPRFGQADKNQQQLTSHLRSLLCGATEKTRTGWLWELRQEALEQPHHIQQPQARLD